MLITLVRDSVMQCFCHTCRAPVMPAGSKFFFFLPLDDSQYRKIGFNVIQTKRTEKCDGE